MTNLSQQKPINILKPLLLSADKGSLSCILIMFKTLFPTDFLFAVSTQ